MQPHLNYLIMITIAIVRFNIFSKSLLKFWTFWCKSKCKFQPAAWSMDHEGANFVNLFFRLRTSELRLMKRRSRDFLTKPFRAKSS